MDIIEKFYTAFQQKDYRTMQSCYHSNASFTDEVFVDLNAAQVKAMWEMLIKAAKEMEVTYKSVQITGDQGRAEWMATYVFSLTNRTVVNRINATFILKDGLIYRHRDHFDFYKWARMAFGGKGVLLGRMPFFRKKIRTVSMGKLAAFMAKK